MRKIVSTALVACLALTGFSQNYVDLAKFTHTSVPSTTIDTLGNDGKFDTPMSQTKLLTSVPIKLSDSLAILTGVDYENHRVQLRERWSTSSMNVTTFKVGLNVKHNAKLSGTYLVLPKLAGDYGNFSNSFQIGGIALFKYRINPQTKLVFGNYLNKEMYGILNVPILGVYHKSKNEKFETDVKFPIIGFADYKLHNNFRIGADFLMIVRTFDITKELGSGSYAQLASNEVGGYFQLDLLKESVVIKAKAIYAMYDYATYLNGATTPFGMFGWYPGDERDRTNGAFSNALGFKVSAIYRFQL